MGNYWQMYVQDNGIGINSQYLERIFVIFQRLHTLAEVTDPSELTFARIALECSVSRRTLYVHFLTPAKMWREAHQFFYAPMALAVTATTVERRLEQGLRHIRESLAAPVTRAALMVNDPTNETRTTILGGWREELSLAAVPVNAPTFSRLVGPLCLDALLLHVPTSDASIRELAHFSLSEDLARS